MTSPKRHVAEGSARPLLLMVDAFVHGPWKGNPAAVCVLPAPRSARWMQGVAARMKLSETAFLYRRGRPGGGFRLRWFTPKLEVALCGHATLASAHALWETGLLDCKAAARFHTRSGVLTAKRRGEWIAMDFPALSPRPAKAPPALFKALGARPVRVAMTRRQYLIELADEAELRRLHPSMPGLQSIDAAGFIVTARTAGRPYDFVSRYFAPAEGIPEDPVTGSAHCALGPYWARILGKNTLVGFQASPRGGVVRVRVGRSRVMIEGKAMTRGRPAIPPLSPP